MADPIIVVLIVLATGGDRPGTTLVSGAAREALGSETRILVEEPSVAPNDADAVALGAQLQAGAVAEVRWLDSKHDQVHVHLYLTADHRWYDRDVTFEAVDAPSERDRAVGFLVGAMVRAALPLAPSAVEVSPVPPVIEAPVVAVPAVPPSSTQAHIPTPPPERRTVRLAVDVAAAGAVGIAGDATGIGPSARAIASLGRFGFQLGGALRFGEVPAAGASSQTLRVGAGAFWVALPGSEGSPFELRFSLDALAVHHRVHRDVPDLSRERWVGGGLVGAAVGWHATSTLEPFLGVGGEGVLGPTPISVGEREVADIPPFRATGELGLRIHF